MPSKTKTPEWEPQTAPCPFEGVEFKELWVSLLSMKKWRKKSLNAIEMAVKRLKKFEVGFATILVENAIEGEYQGVVFTDSQKKYEEWKRQKTTNNGQKRFGDAGRTIEFDAI